MSAEALHLTLSAELAALERIRPIVLAWLDARGASERLRYDVELVLEELLSNVIRHGQAAADRDIAVVLSVTGDSVMISITDAGQPFDPRRFDPPEPEPILERRRTRGHGLLLVRKVAEIVSYERKGGRNLLEVRLREPLARTTRNLRGDPR